MRRLFWFGILALSARAQSVLDGPADDDARAAFSSPVASVLRCQFSKMPPALDYRFRFQVAFTIALPIDELRGQIGGWRLLLRVTPEGRNPIFLSIADAKPEPGGLFKAGFAVGEGGYSIAAILRNEFGGSCTSSWRIDAHAQGPERTFDSPLAPGAVAAIDSIQPSSPVLRRNGARIVILLDAASFVPGRAKIDESDIRALSESLQSLVERLPARSLRLVVFRLDRSDPIFEDDNFTGNISGPVEALRNAELAVVDYQSLRGSRDRIEIAVNLIRRELARPDAPAAIVVAGPYTPLPEGASETTPKVAPLAARLFYLQYRQFRPSEDPPDGGTAASHGHGAITSRECCQQRKPLIAPAGPPDPIAQAVKALKGDRLEIYSPRNLAAALRRIQQSF
jgi:hypothetical protein